MAEALLVDLVKGGCHSCVGASELGGLASHCQVFLLSAAPQTDNNDIFERFKGECKNVHVLEAESVASGLYQFKQILDELGLSVIKVLTSASGRQWMESYRELLFTPVYAFEYDVHAAERCTCVTCPGHAPSVDSPGEWAREEVASFLRQMPALKGEVEVHRSTLIPDCFGNGFSSRGGGLTSIPTLSSLNLFCSGKRRDPRAVVDENRRRLAEAAGFHPRAMHLPKVNHANEVWVMGKAAPDTYDGIVTDRSGVVLAAQGADCMPLLFADPVKRVIGATHAGWKGTVMGAAMSTVNSMVREFGSDVGDILVAVGPSVGVCCYTMDQKQIQDFIKIHPDCVPDPESARPHVNIRLANRVLLQNGGVLPEHIHDDTVRDRPQVTPCTCCNPQKYFSRVRDGDNNFGIQVGFVWIRDEQNATERFDQ